MMKKQAILLQNSKLYLLSPTYLPTQKKEEKRVANHQAIIKKLTCVNSSLTAKEQVWLRLLKEVVCKNISNFHYNVKELAADMQLSRQHLTRRLRQLTGLTAQQYLKEERLKVAKQLLENGSMTTSVKAVALEIGYKDIKYFSRLFKQRFGELPSNCLHMNIL